MDYALNKRIDAFKYLAQEKLQAILCSIPLQKNLIIESNLIKPLEHVCSASWIKSKGVERIFRFDQKNVPPTSDNLHVYLISANVLLFKLVLDQIHSQNVDFSTIRSTGIKKYHIIFFPDIYPCFQTLLEEEGLYGFCELYRFNWNFINLDDRLLSLEIPNLFEDVFVKHDTSILNSVAHSLRTFHVLFGQPDITICSGNNSVKIAEMVLRLEKSRSFTSQQFSEYSAMLIIDRSEDYPSCLLSPAIYSGLLSEVFKCTAGELEFDQNSNKISSGKKEILRVNTNANAKNKVEKGIVLKMSGKHDKMYEENRYKHFSDASKTIQTQAKALGIEIQNLQQMKINEIQDYVAKKLPHVTVLKNKILKHMNICEVIIRELAGSFQTRQQLEEDILNGSSRRDILDKINEIVITDGHQFNTVRLLCLFHLSLGLTLDELFTFMQNYLNIFGYKFIPMFKALANAKLLPKMEDFTLEKNKFLGNLQITTKFQQTEFQANANRLKLLPSASSNDNKKNMSESNICPSYVFNGIYIPLVAQLANILLKSESIDDVCSKLGGAMSSIQCLISNSLDSLFTLKNYQTAIKKGEMEDKFPIKKTLFVLVIGGVSYAEIAACDFVSKLSGSKIVIISSSVITGSDLVSTS